MGRFISWENLCMVWNSLLEHGSIGSPSPFLNLGIVKANGITQNYNTFCLSVWYNFERRWCGRNEGSKESSGKGIWK